MAKNWKSGTNALIARGSYLAKKANESVVLESPKQMEQFPDYLELGLTGHTCPQRSDGKISRIVT